MGIARRPEAGKRPMVVEVFQLIELCEGWTGVDRADACKIGLCDPRMSLGIVSQKSALFNEAVWMEK